MKNFFTPKHIKRALRITAFALATGLAFMGAGNVWGIDALTSALFGATGAVIGLVAALLFLYAGKGEVPDEEFDSAINSSIESVRSQTEKKK